MADRQAETRIALVTGAQRGIGLEVARGLGKLGYTVILTGIVAAKGRAAAKQLQKEGCNALFFPLDVTKEKDVQAAKRFVDQMFGRLDVLVNNAGVLIDGEKGILKVKSEVFQKVFEINTLGGLRMCQAFVPMMIKQNYGRIVNVASGRGQLSGEDKYAMIDDAPAYNMSKTAVNAMTLMLANATESTNVLVNSLCPGWCRTDMGGESAPRSAKKGAETIIWLATLPDKGPTGGFFRDKKRIPW